MTSVASTRVITMSPDDDNASSRKRPVLQAIDGGREALEREFLWALMTDAPDKEALGRRLDRAANAPFLGALPDFPANDDAS